MLKPIRGFLFPIKKNGFGARDIGTRNLPKIFQLLSETKKIIFGDLKEE